MTSNSLTVCCICSLYLGMIVYAVIMSYRNIKFNDEAQVHILRYGTMPEM